ncbi:hypothetical protein [Saccharibacillus kuerlensis]|uniref:Uncharacterized protein n=1 Tax=Saccharibacillus kuerlensis TaxID=459527 RepID=A0ABQ2L4Z3_9BACL|nr:hypothetical protein [Saccharibacillus kuerlensis]GGO03667.1 hypothetical protein GCM10010969_28040 [Saccharibacillus kuerlensis]
MSNVPVSVLSIRTQKREGYPCPFEYGDFLIEGKPLALAAQFLQEYPHFDDIGCLGFGSERFQREQIERLLLDGEADFPNDRRSLYICPACGDLGCGAVSVRIHREKKCFVWSDFGIQSHPSLEPHIILCPWIGPFYFEETAYAETIRASYGLGGFHWPYPAK